MIATRCREANSVDWIDLLERTGPARTKANLMNRRNLLKYSLASLSAAAWPYTASAYPDRAIRLIVPFSPGGATDVAARLWAEKMKPHLGTVVIENKGGGGGAIGATEVARSTPDGHTFVFGNTSTQV